MFLRVPIAFSLLGSSLLVFSLNDRLEIWTVAQRLFFGIDSFVLLAIPLFILVANLMNVAGVTDRLIRLAQALVGWISGGLGLVNIAVSMLFAGVSGSSTADTAAVGGVLLPQMEKKGYKPGFSVGVTASSSVMGMIIPPSITMIIWAALTKTSVGAMFLGGIVPGILIGFVLMLICYVISRREGYPREEAPGSGELYGAISGSILAMGVPATVLFGITLGIVTPTEAAVLAVWYALFLGFFVFRSLRIGHMPSILKATAATSVLPLFALASASVFGYLLAYYQFPNAMQSVLSTIPLAFVIFIIILVWIVVGTFLDAVPAMIIMIPVFKPTVEAAGLDPVHYGVVSILALSVGLITPPYGLCLLIAAQLGKTSIGQAFLGTLPFLIGVVLVVLACAALPLLVTFVPSLVF
jgi:tripartite ATP-independent transporter DctM subunit